MRHLPFFLLVLALFFPAAGWAGNEGNIWYFGNQAGVDFNSGSPVALTDGQLITAEGCASIADAAGALLFYTDGTTVWNRDHGVMQTGLLGNSSATQSAIIVPVINSTTDYYIFTAAAASGSAGLQYSIVDMTANGGLGAVTMLNQPIQLGVQTEKLAIAQHSNGADLWLLSANVADQYLAFPITAAGVNTTAIVTTVPSTRTRVQEAGYLKIGPDNSSVVAAFFIESIVEFLSFDSTTGQFVLLDAWSTGVTNNGYGVEFSPNGSLFYVSDAAGGRVLQYDVSATPVSSSGIVLSDTVASPGAISIASDGKLYIAKFSSPFLAAIDQPDVLGLGATFIEDAVDLNGGISAGGLPSIPQFLAGPPTLDLAVSQSESADPVTAGSGAGNLTYVVTVTNIGPSDATGVVLDEVLTLPAGVTEDSTTVSAGTFGGGTWTLGDLANGASETLTIVLTVGPAVAAGSDVISSSAAVSAVNETDIDSANDAVSDSTSVASASGLSMLKTADAMVVFAGDPLTYSVQVDNSGPSDLAAGTVTDIFAAELLDPLWTCTATPGSTCTAGPVAGNINDAVSILAGGTVIYTALATVDPNFVGSLVNTASITSPQGASSSATETTEIVARPTVIEVPTLSQWGLLAMSLLLATAAAATFSQRRG